MVLASPRPQADPLARRSGCPHHNGGTAERRRRQGAVGGIRARFDRLGDPALSRQRPVRRPSAPAPFCITIGSCGISRCLVPPYPSPRLRAARWSISSRPMRSRISGARRPRYSRTSSGSPAITGLSPLTRPRGCVSKPPRHVTGSGLTRRSHAGSTPQPVRTRTCRQPFCCCNTAHSARATC